MTQTGTIVVMHERSKLTEARHFLERMYVERGNPAAFAHELSAFVGAARSVLQHVHKEAKVKPGGQQWYDQTMANPLLRFFRQMRNDSTHEGPPVTPARMFTTEAAGLLNIGDDDDEFLIPYPHDTTVQRYEFQNRPGEEVIDLSQRYLKVLEEFVKDGVAKEWITGGR